MTFELFTLHNTRRDAQPALTPGLLRKDESFSCYMEDESFSGSTRTQEQLNGQYCSGGCFKVWNNFWWTFFLPYYWCLTTNIMGLCGILECHSSLPFIQKQNKVSSLVWVCMDFILHKIKTILFVLSKQRGITEKTMVWVFILITVRHLFYGLNNSLQ